MELSAIAHKANESFCYKICEHEYVIRLETKKNDLKSVKLAYLDKYAREKDLLVLPSETFYIEMKKVASSNIRDYYEATISDVIFLHGVTKKIEESINKIQDERFKEYIKPFKNLEGSPLEMLSTKYYFILEDEASTVYFGNDKFYFDEPQDVFDMFCFIPQQQNLMCLEDTLVSKGVIYEIFAERFYPTNGIYSKNWFKSPLDYRDRMNGTLHGIYEKIPYLKDLGVDAIYLTPIFSANSSHRYDTKDYMEIDAPLGTKEDFKLLVDTLHKNNIKIILDLVFNHTSIDFFAFQDILKHQENSIYKDWYHIKEFPVDPKIHGRYKGFSYSSFMPKLNTENEACRKYLLEVARTYLEEFDVDGYRLDVSDEVTHSFWKKFHKVCKSIKPNMVIIGEIWYDATTFLRGDEFDSVMNYTFYDLVRGLLKKKYNISEFVSYMNELRGKNGQIRFFNSNNLIGSHDTDRISTYLSDEKDNRIALTLLLTLPGTPILYYGDEIMMEGQGDPDCRRGMVFDTNQEAFAFTKRLIEIKHKEASRSGEFSMWQKKDVLFYSLESAKEKLIFMINFGNRVDTGYRGINLLDTLYFDGYIDEKGICILEVLHDE